MKIKVINKKNESNELTKFIDEMFERWLEDSCFAKENSCCPGRTKRQIIERIENIDDSNYQFLVAVDENDKVQGMVYMSYFEDGSAYLGLINVHPAQRDQKIFKELLAKAIEECNKKRLQYIRLNTWIENVNAIAVFEKSGFVICEKKDSSVEMRLMLK